MRKLLFYIAVTGWTLGLIVHLFLIADVDITDKVPFAGYLHIGVFVVWIPMILYLKDNEELKQYKSGLFNRTNRFGVYKIIFKQTPTRLIIIAVWSFFYTILNFMLFMTSSYSGVPGIRDGQLVLQDHGRLIKTLTEQEYYHYKANELRGFSGHWLAFYGIAAAVLYSFGRSNKLS